MKMYFKRMSTCRFNSIYWNEIKALLNLKRISFHGSNCPCSQFHFHFTLISVNKCPKFAWIWFYCVKWSFHGELGPADPHLLSFQVWTKSLPPIIFCSRVIFTLVRDTCFTPFCHRYLSCLFYIFPPLSERSLTVISVKERPNLIDICLEIDSCGFLEVLD